MAVNQQNVRSTQIVWHPADVAEIFSCCFFSRRCTLLFQATQARGFSKHSTTHMTAGQWLQTPVTRWSSQQLQRLQAAISVVRSVCHVVCSQCAMWCAVGVQSVCSRSVCSQCAVNIWCGVTHPFEAACLHSSLLHHTALNIQILHSAMMISPAHMRYHMCCVRESVFLRELPSRAIKHLMLQDRRLGLSLWQLLTQWLTH